ncbi:Asp-tRNA(Asn)/Glu-tRNA(Gln) amidotransferase subunit GatA [Dethiobacter alkaliphilus]|uniref:Asp-tRNA(Asn)/Glu-tRNA(Gln) amidotransferase subunit GatA n=1 Tax=Dethiobacter alkaliphilus TaxID=427926 RepID=UPI0022262F45|nr:Asp-tRNA(Asn)/Glu-tRNA(Gln) amidotransferase subunit GatA [Dethiobacter alkaliphilus]MCW3489808.1 Asp-tRNA(Asn)/Glu-tRNA(Gln) amidotransferase subunit GatA [Dethiobacter alkaliphilus]
MLEKLTVAEALDKLNNKEISSRELTEAVLSRIDSVEETIKAYVTVTRQEALAKAAQIDAKRLNGEKLGPLAGIPVALKDNMCTNGILTTCSSKMLHNFLPPYDATVTELLQDAGTVLVGKTNMDEFAMGSSTENSAFFTTRNPWDVKRVPGGSSGGSAAAVAAGEATFSLGSDTGGSIRQPAAYCGVVGMKPTYGRVSRYGVVAFASSLDQVGPVTKDVKDCALVMNAIAQYDPRDTTSADVPTPDYTQGLDGNVKGMKIGVPKEYFVEEIDPGIKDMVRKAIDVLVSLGAEAEEISLPHTHYGIPAYYLIAPAEASSNLARFDGVQYGFRAEGADSLIEMYKKTRSEGFGNEVKRRIMLGTYSLSSGYYDDYYLKAQKVRTLIKQDFDEAFKKYDVIITPTTPNTAFVAGTVEDLLTMYLNDICTIGVNMSGLPALSVPCGFAEGLPVGMQFIGKAFDEATILKAAYAYEQNRGVKIDLPELSGKGGAAQ